MKACLLLEDGTRFEGRGLGAQGVRFGEVIFSTSMTGYQELLTDPSYRGQILVSTLAHVGNVGINEGDHESVRAWLSGFVVQDTPRRYSNWRATQGLSSWLEDEGVVALCDVDTRAVVKRLREHGAMRGAICNGSVPADLLQQVVNSPTLDGRNLVAEVTCEAVTSQGDSGQHVVAYDFGMKNYMVDLLLGQGLKVTRVPAQTSAKDVLEMRPDGVFLSNGPGDPAALDGIAQEVKSLLGKVPIFGICLGHQLLARALGANTFKLKFGHHGTNHPVKDLSTGRVEITTQNHGFAVDEETLPSGVELTHVNLNDGTCEGIACPSKRAFSVQYHPENAPGPQDSRYLFERFVNNLEVGCHA
jgi:carbamoyl-phosphate synthase small subunit